VRCDPEQVGETIGEMSRAYVEEPEMLAQEFEYQQANPPEDLSMSSRNNDSQPLLHLLKIAQIAPLKKIKVEQFS
jgi:hypothetical protein